MGKLGDMIKAIIDKPDDLSTLPEIVEKVNVLETSEAGLLDRVAALQEVNRKYLQMIPVAGTEPEPQKKPEPLPDMRAVAKAIEEEMQKEGVI